MTNHRVIFTTPTGAQTHIGVLCEPGDDAGRLAGYAVIAAAQALGCPPSMLTVRPEDDTLHMLDLRRQAGDDLTREAVEFYPQTFGRFNRYVCDPDVLTSGFRNT